MIASLSPSGVVALNQVPACPVCGAITSRLGLDRRQCTHGSCLRVMEFKVSGHRGNGRVAFSLDGTDPARLLRGGRVRGARCHYRHRAPKQ